MRKRSGCPPQGFLREVARGTLGAEGVKGGVEINLLLAGEAEITRLNRRYLGRDTPTDVIAFGAKKGMGGARAARGYLGDIAISVDAARYNARRFKTTPKEEIALYVIHGILHLLGYDDTNERAKKLMEKRQFAIMRDVVCRAG